MKYYEIRDATGLDWLKLTPPLRHPRRSSPHRCSAQAGSWELPGSPKQVEYVALVVVNTCVHHVFMCNISTVVKYPFFSC